MKTIKEIVKMLVCELDEHIDNIKSPKRELDYYNEILGDTSFLLAGLLDSLLKKNNKDWDSDKWIDDCLITKVEVENLNLTMSGIMIWGRENTTEQWTDPFSFEIGLLEDGKNFKSFSFMFSDLDSPEISYDEFKNRRNYWHSGSRNWKYTIDSDI